MKKILLLQILLALCVQIRPQTGADNPYLDSHIIEQMAMGGIVGLSAGIISGDELSWSRGYGYADIEKETPFTTGTLINVASVTKTLTAACLMKLVEMQYLFLDLPVNEIIPFEIPREITLRQLATHTSGIIDQDKYYNDEGYFYMGKERTPLGPYLMNYLSSDGDAYAESNFSEAAPGEVYEYSNIGAGLAGYVVECVSGMGLDKFSRKYFLDPLDMKHTGWFLEDIDRDLHTMLYKSGGEDIIPFYELATYPDGNLRTSVEELSHFLICMANEGAYNDRTVLGKKTIAEMFEPQFKSGQYPAGFSKESENSGIFWSLETSSSGEQVIGHSGGDPGVITLMYYNLSRRYGVILLLNTEGQSEAAASIFQELWKTAGTIH